jgi:hypothetical protein
MPQLSFKPAASPALVPQRRAGPYCQPLGMRPTNSTASLDGSPMAESSPTFALDWCAAKLPTKMMWNSSSTATEINEMREPTRYSRSEALNFLALLW